MRLIFLLPAVVVLGVIGGVAIAYVEFGPMFQGTQAVAGSSTASQGPQPEAVAEQMTFNFGAIELGGSMRHSFTVKNAGQAPLKLTKGSTTCKCTLSELDNSEIPPGGEGSVSLEWKGEGEIGPFRQTATILTNDPKQPRLTFTVEGELTEAITVEPYELVFTSISAREPYEAELRLYARHSEDLKVTDYRVEGRSGSEQFELTFEPLTEDELKANDAKSGVLARVVTKPVLPLGPIRQKIVLQTNLASKPTVEVPLRGMVVSDISVIGPDWNNERSTLQVGLVQSAQGAKRTLRLVTRGEYRNDVRFSVHSKYPEFLKVSLGEIEGVGQGQVTQVPITIEIPPGSPAANHLGTSIGRLGEVVLKTTHPDVPEMTLRLQFAIEE